jgi:hypothetical protein
MGLDRLPWLMVTCTNRSRASVLALGITQPPEVARDHVVADEGCESSRHISPVREWSQRAAEVYGMKALRERRGLRRFTIGVSEDDLRVIAEHGYEGAASADQDCRSQAVSLFISDTVACLDRNRWHRHSDSVTGCDGVTYSVSK